MSKKIVVEISPLVASCLQRMISEEIENQECWKLKDITPTTAHNMRNIIIEEMKNLSDLLESKGIDKFRDYR